MLGFPRKPARKSPTAKRMGTPIFGGAKATHARPGERTYTRHTDAVFTDDERARFFLGEEIQCRSSHVLTAQWDEKNQSLILGYSKDNHMPVEYYLAYYPVDLAQAYSFSESPSKGGWRWDFFPNGGVGYNKIAAAVPLT